MIYCYVKIVIDGSKYDPTLVKTNVGDYYILDTYQCESAMEKIPSNRVDEILSLVDGYNYTLEITNAPD